MRKSLVNRSRLPIFTALLSLLFTVPLVFATITSVNLVSPSNNTYTNDVTPQLTCNATSNGTLENITFWVWNSTGVVNKTNVTVGGSANETSWNVSPTLNEGSYEWNCQAWDNTSADGNFSASNRTLTVDTTSPSITLNSPTSDSILNSKSIAINLTATDTNLNYTNISIINSTGSIVNSTTNSTNRTYTATLSVQEDGVYNITATTHDLAENSNSTTNSNITVDTTPPTTSASAVISNGSSYTFGTWTNSTYVNVTLTCDDGSGSGCNVTQYCLDTTNSCTPNLTYSSPVQISTEGTSYIRFQSNDTVGNEETAKNESVKIDTEIPDAGVNSVNNLSSGKYTSNTNLVINFTANDTNIDTWNLSLLNSTKDLIWTGNHYTPWRMFHKEVTHKGRGDGADVIYVGSVDNKLYALNPDGSVKWSYATGDIIRSSPAIPPDGTVYVGSLDNKLYALNPDGTLKWSYTTGDYIYWSSPTIGDDGTIYFGSEDNKLYALNPDGTLKWSYTTGSYVESSPAIADDGTIYFGSEDNKLYALNPDGTLKWSYTTGDFVESSPAIAPDGTVYVGSCDNNLYALNPDGTLKWSYATGGCIYWSSPAIAEDGTVYIGSEDNKLYAINPDGTLRWSYTTGDWVDATPAIAEDGTIYVGSQDSRLYALNPDGTLKWSYATGSSIISSPAIAPDGTVYVGSRDNKLYAINPDGTLKWSYDTGNRVVSSPALAGKTLNEQTGMGSVSHNVSKDGTYFINLTVRDKSGKTNSSTFNITVDTTPPAISLSCNNIYEGDNQDCSCSASDETSGVNTTSITTADTSSSGTKTVICSVTDYAGNSISKSTTYEVYSSGGGGGGGTYTPPAPKQSHIWTSIASGATVRMNITKKELGVKQIQVQVKNKANNVELTVTKQEGKPASIEHKVSGKTYKYMKIDAENLEENNTEEAKIQFQVNKSWIKENNIDPETVSLNRYHNNSWQRLNTTKLSENQTHIIYEAETPGFSYFAVSGEEYVCEEGTEECMDNELQKCVDNEWVTQETCKYGCNETTFECNAKPKEKKICTEGEVRCSGNELQECQNNQWTAQKTCDYGCNSTTLECNPAPAEGEKQPNYLLIAGIIILIALIAGGTCYYFKIYQKE